MDFSCFRLNSSKSRVSGGKFGDFGRKVWGLGCRGYGLGVGLVAVGFVISAAQIAPRGSVW